CALAKGVPFPPEERFSVRNALRFKPYGLSFRGKNAAAPSASGRAARVRDGVPFLFFYFWNSICIKYEKVLRSGKNSRPSKAEKSAARRCRRAGRNHDCC
ncbi:hypothetical protein, partial [uncultured Desulfovibrio sp.]|uniref:hypothetical protein n=1 Tax=uncultured Desulfovibrio sp. TaxID=167968 RepID=UPI00261192C2